MEKLFLIPQWVFLIPPVTFIGLKIYFFRVYYRDFKRMSFGAGLMVFACLAFTVLDFLIYFLVEGTQEAVTTIKWYHGLSMLSIVAMVMVSVERVYNQSDEMINKVVSCVIGVFVIVGLYLSARFVVSDDLIIGAYRHTYHLSRVKGINYDLFFTAPVIAGVFIALTLEGLTVLRSREQFNNCLRELDFSGIIRASRIARMSEMSLRVLACSILIVLLGMTLNFNAIVFPVSWLVSVVSLALLISAVSGHDIYLICTINRLLWRPNDKKRHDTLKSLDRSNITSQVLLDSKALKHNIDDSRNCQILYHYHEYPHIGLVAEITGYSKGTVKKVVDEYLNSKVEKPVAENDSNKIVEFPITESE